MLGVAIPFLIILLVISNIFWSDYKKIKSQVDESNDIDEKLLIERKARKAKNNFYSYFIPAILVALMILFAVIAIITN